MRTALAALAAVGILALSLGPSAAQTRRPAAAPTTIAREVRTVLAKQFNVPAQTIVMDVPLVDSPLNASERDVADVVKALEERFGIEIPADKIMNKDEADTAGVDPMLTPRRLELIVKQTLRARSGR